MIILYSLIEFICFVFEYQLTVQGKDLAWTLGGRQMFVNIFIDYLLRSTFDQREIIAYVIVIQERILMAIFRS